MAKAIDSVKNSADVVDMIIFVSSNRKLKSKGKTWDLSSPEKEYAAGVFPLNKIFDGTFLNWILGYTAHYAKDAEKNVDDNGEPIKSTPLNGSQFARSSVATA